MADLLCGCAADPFDCPSGAEYQPCQCRCHDGPHQAEAQRIVDEMMAEAKRPAPPLTADNDPVRDGRLFFPCGATYERVNSAVWEKKVKRGRVRLIILDTQDLNRPKPPRLNGEMAPCVARCPAEKYRRVTRAMSDGPDPFALRYVITCSGVLESGEGEDCDG